MGSEGQFWVPAPIVNCAWSWTPAENGNEWASLFESVELRHKGISVVSRGERRLLKLTIKHPSGQTRRGHVSERTITRMLRRNKRSTASILGCGNLRLELIANLSAKLSQRNDCGSSYTAHPSFYALQRLTCGAKIELFADCINESGVMEGFYSKDCRDLRFGSHGQWKPDVDASITYGAVGNPPFDNSFLSTVLETFDKGVKQRVPYCRILLLPLRVAKFHTQSPGCPAYLIASIAPGFMAFKHQSGFFEFNNHVPSTHVYMPLGIVAWVNDIYLRSVQIPEDIEASYRGWGFRCFNSSAAVTVDMGMMFCTFPPHLRACHSVSHHFGVS